MQRRQFVCEAGSPLAFICSQAFQAALKVSLKVAIVVLNPRPVQFQMASGADLERLHVVTDADAHGSRGASEESAVRFDREGFAGAEPTRRRHGEVIECGRCLK